MKYHQQISLDLVNMVYTAIAYLALAGAAWLFLRLVQACFCLPSRLKRQNDVQHLLEEKVESYERYIKECEEKEAVGEMKDDGDDQPLEEKRKERQECLAMLKRELQRIMDGGDPYDCSYLLEEEEKKLLAECDKELEERLEDVEKEEQDEKATDEDESEKQREDMESSEKKKLLEVPDVKFELKKDK